jgi:4-hydroxy-tetrahydrodipicolinate reductase
MKIAIVGYGKMGKAIERIARDKGYTITAILEDQTASALQQIQPGFADVALEFTQPDAAADNIRRLLLNKTPIVSGTTGWWNALPEITELLAQQDGTLIYGGNFSVGMNLMFQMNQLLARWMNHFEDFDPWVLEKHHRHKKDAPGGSALMLARQILDNLSRKSILAPPQELHHRAPYPEELSIGCIRSGEIIGIHEVGYGNGVETIRLQHQAESRDGFAQGALMAAKWATHRKGLWSFSEMLSESILMNE